MKWCFVVAMCAVIVACVFCDPDDAKTRQIAEVFEARKKKFHNFLMLIGGLKGLIIFLLVKMKLFLLAVLVVGLTLFTVKSVGSYPNKGYYDTYYPEIHHDAPHAFDHPEQNLWIEPEAGILDRRRVYKVQRETTENR